MDKENIQKLIKNYKHKPTARIRETVVKELRPLVYHIAHRFAHRGEALDDVAQIGMVGLLKGLEHYNAKKNHEFIPYIITTIIGEIKHYFRDQFATIRIPRKYQELSYTMNKFIQKYIQAHSGQWPTITEISQNLHISEELILEASEALHLTSLLSGRNDAEPDGGHLPEKFTDFTEKLETGLLLQDMLNILSPREQKILRLYFLKNETQQTIATQLKLSQGHVFRILQQAIKKCKKYLQKTVGEITIVRRTPKLVKKHHR
jgi:RNA polymerase sigma-B factor